MFKQMFSTNLSLLAMEVGVYSCALMFAVAFPNFRLPWMRACKESFQRFAQNRTISVLAVISLSLFLRGALVPLLPTPVPGVHDEYSYILAGETFAAGRVVNPPHPLWKSLETFYVIQQPTYASMYPPGQGLAIAVGELLARNPWLGVYLSVAAMCGSVCWMLQGWISPQWALAGGILSVLRFGVYSYWTESYWGGAVAALGGALVLGALPRVIRNRNCWPAVVLGTGVLILANSRPFEGLLLSAPVFVMLIFWLLKRGRRETWLVLRRAAPALALVLILGGAAMTYYFWRATGSPFRMPYQLHSERYEVTGPFLWQPLRPTPHFRYVEMEKYHVERQTAAYVLAHSWRGWLGETWRKAESIAIFYFWPGVLPTLIAIPVLLRGAKSRFAILVAVVMFVGLTLEIWPMTLHYHAPMTAVMVLLLVQVIRYSRLFQWRGKPVGAAIAWTIPLFCAGILAMRVSAAILQVPVPEHGLAPWFTVAPGNLDRAKVLHYLEGQPGPQLAFVRYSVTHHVDEEWVHNAAQIDSSKVVWARDASAQENSQVLAYFPERQAWLIEPDQKPPRLTPLSTSTITSIQHN